MRRHLIILTLTLGTIACTDRTASTSGPLASPSLTGSIPEQTDYPDERAYKELALVVPSHGGLYFDTLTGDLNVYLKDLSEGPAAKRALPLIFGQALAGARLMHPHAGIVFKQGAYTFIELARWRDALDDVLKPPSVQWFGIDHAQNRIVIGVIAGADRQAITAMAVDLAIPAGALRFEGTAPVRSEQTLEDSIRPVKGGILGGTDTTVTLGGLHWGRTGAQASDTIPARLILYADTAAIVVPDTVRLGQAFTVTVTAFAGGCIRTGGGSRVSIHGLVADVTPLHVRRVVGNLCTDDLILFPQTISLRFERGGLGRIRFHGAANRLDFRAQPQWVVIERRVVVR